MKNKEVRVKGETDNYSICQPAAHRMIVHVLLYLTTVVVRFNQGPCRNMGVICSSLTFWFFCVKTKE